MYEKNFIFYFYVQCLKTYYLITEADNLWMSCHQSLDLKEFL